MARWIDRLALGPDETILDRLLTLSPEERQRLLREMPRKYVQELDERWYQWAHGGQREPPGDWPVWLIRAGRGFGKTRAGAEWVSQIARDRPAIKLGKGAAQAQGQPQRIGPQSNHHRADQTAQQRRPPAGGLQLQQFKRGGGRNQPRHRA